MTEQAAKTEELIAKGLPPEAFKLGGTVREAVPRAANIDPLSSMWLNAHSVFPSDIHHGTGILTYTTLRAMSRVPYVASIFITRMNQASDFAQPQPDPYSLGFVIETTDKRKLLSRKDRVNIGEITEFILNGGGDYFPGGFESSLRATVANTLTFDQVNMEKCVDASTNKPWCFVPADPATIRRKAPDRKDLKDFRWDLKDTGFVQVINNRVVNEFAPDRMSWWIRNQEDYIYRYGYGAPELEKALGIVAALINAITHNTVNYTTGIHSQNMIEAGVIGSDERLSSLERIIATSTSGIRHSRRTPIFQVNPALGEFLKVHPLGSTNKEMEFSEWINFLKKQLCFPPGEEAVLADGSLLAIEEVTPGTAVMSHSGRSRKVVNIQSHHYDGDLITIKAAGRTVRATTEHPFLVSRCTVDGKMLRTFSEPEWVEAGDIVEGIDYLVVPKPKQAASTQFVTEIDLASYVDRATSTITETTIKPSSNRSNTINRKIVLDKESGYALGLYMAKKCGCRSGSNVTFSFGPDEQEYAEAAAALFSSLGMRSRIEHRSSGAGAKADGRVNCIQTVGCSRSLSHALHGLFGHKAVNKSIPHEIRNAHPDVQRAFLSGYIAGDGSCYETKQPGGTRTITVSLGTASKVASEQAQHMLLQQGIFAGVYKVNQTTRNGCELWDLRVNGAQLKKLVSWMTGPKADKLSALLVGWEQDGKPSMKNHTVEEVGYFLVPVTSTWRELYSGPVHNMEVEVEHTYCMSRYAVHNCSLYQMDPAELGDIFGNEGQKSQGGSTSPTDRIHASKERGLRPLMRYIQRWHNQFLIAPHWPGYRLVFKGFDSVTEEKKIELDLKAVTAYVSPNELRIERGLEPWDDPVSKRPLNALYTAYIQNELANQSSGIDDSITSLAGI